MLEKNNTSPDLLLKRSQIMTALIFFTLVIFAFHFGSWSLKQAGVPKAEAFTLLFDVNTEANISSFFSALLFLISALLLFVIHKIEGAKVKITASWFLYSCLFLFLAFDEAGQIHEKLTNPTRALLGDGEHGLLYFAWVLPYFLLVLILGIASISFLKKTDPKTRNRMILAGVVFLCGSLGAEMIGGDLGTEDPDNFSYMFTYSIEEFLEFAGLLLMIRALLMHLEKYKGELLIKFV